jgi:hypothetical protein
LQLPVVHLGKSAALAAQREIGKEAFGRAARGAIVRSVMGLSFGFRDPFCGVHHFC